MNNTEFAAEIPDFPESFDTDSSMDFKGTVIHHRKPDISEPNVKRSRTHMNNLVKKVRVSLFETIRVTLFETIPRIQLEEIH